jgi:hypothetical protein
MWKSGALAPRPAIKDIGALAPEGSKHPRFFRFSKHELLLQIGPADS